MGFWHSKFGHHKCKLSTFLDLYNLNSKLKIKSAVLLMGRLNLITLKCLAHFCKYYK